MSDYFYSMHMLLLENGYSIFSPSLQELSNEENQ